MKKKPNSHLKKKLNTKFQIVIMQTTKKPINISMPKTFGKILIASFFIFILFSIFLIIDNRNLKSTISNRNNQITALKYETSLRTKENTELKNSLNDKNEILKEKTSQIENQIRDLDNFQQTIRDLVGLGQGGSDVSSRDMSFRSNLLFQELSKTPKIDTLSYDITNINSIYSKLEEYENMLVKNKEELNCLYNEVEERLDYLDRVPNFFPAIGKITSYFGYRKNPFNYCSEYHHGIDIANYSGTEILSAGKGTVLETGYDHLLGRYIIINHGYNFITKYAHLRKINVEENEKVEKGQAIGLMGNTGQSTGPHLHFEIRLDGEVIDPLKINEIYN